MKTIFLPALLVVSAVCFNILVQGAALNDASVEPTTQLKAIAGDRAHLVEQFKAKNIQLLTNDYLKSNSLAIGLLRTNKWNIVAASKALKRLIQWRAANKIDELGKAETNPELLKRFPYRITATTKEGCPVLEFDGGKWLIPAFMESHDFVRDAVEKFDSYITQMVEKSRVAVANNPKLQCDQVLMLVNVKGFSAKNYADANALSAIVRTATTFETHFPNLFSQTIVIESNQDVANLFKIMSPFFGHTVAHMSLYTTEQREQARTILYKSIEPEQLSPEYLGVKKA